MKRPVVPTAASVGLRFALAYASYTLPTEVSASSSPSKLASAGRAAVSVLRAGKWANAIDRLDEIQEIASTVPRDERELYQAVDGLQQAALGLRNDAETRELRKNVTTQRIDDLAALTKDLTEAIERTGYEPSDDELREAEGITSMSSGKVDIETQDGVADAYLSRPDDERHPGVLLLMDAFGVRPQIERMADRIAERGFVVLAPNVFYRHGRAPVLPMPDLEDPEECRPFMEKIGPMMGELSPERTASDGRGYLDFLAEVARGPFAITGYCMGARLGWRIATAHPDRVAALAGFHAGGLVTDDADSPHRSAGELTAEVYFGHADSDRSMTPENIAALEQALDEAEVTYRSEVYAGAAHGYTMADTSMYNEAAAERHFTELFGLLDRTVAA